MSHPANRVAPIMNVAAALGLRFSGRNAHCFNAPAHQGGEDKSPSLVFFPDTDRFHCFGCGVHGDTIYLVRGVRCLSFRGAVTWLEQVGRGSCLASSSPASMQSKLPDASTVEVYGRLFALGSPPTTDSPAGQYLRRRGISCQTAERLGARELFDPLGKWCALRSEFSDERVQAVGLTSSRDCFLFAEHALLFFYFDGNLPVFVQARSIEQSSAIKELRPAGIQCPVPFNRNLLASPPAQVFICEGCVDTLSASQLGHPAVGIPGVQTFRTEWFALFKDARQISILFDNDEAGRRQGVELQTQFRLRGFQANVLRPASGKDVNDLLVSLGGGSGNE